MTEPHDSRDREASSRASYLLDGRRVRVSDLLRHGLLKEGETLAFMRRRLGDTYKATVTGKGWLRLENGEEVRSPSRAAAIAVGGGSFDGWHAWTLDDGRTLDQLRQELLDSSVSQITDRDDEDSSAEPSVSATERHILLRRAAQQAESGEPVSVSVQDLLGWWGASGRGTVNERIEADLANHGLTTSPNFDKVPLATTVQLVRETLEKDLEEALDEPLALHLKTVPPADEVAPETGLTIGTLPSALGHGVVSVKPTATFEEAITLMTLHDFSQLPVLTGPYNLRGAVSWKSIARARHADPEASFSQAVMDAREVRYDHDLIDVLPILAESDFVLVRDQHNKIAGIVTAADVAQAYGDLASHFLLIGEMDRRLRQIIAGTFTFEEVSALCDPNTERLASFGDMTVGDYQRVLENPACWEQLGWPLDRKVFAAWLGEVRKIRNNVMHFNSSDPLPKADVDKIRNLNRLLRDYGE
ncbi:CBS domain-containing protein [Streptomyces sp. MJP52]|uniref:restriction system modified-DNA reader domain-containing protein n=1 Tax=Streptomyces sp. MJP52 TaxID=2940555 RepID=UPI00247381CF|nr:CBS domain-containing protein [Streptomyces sp. MJP52]MDH6227833.1 CBS domain-containing protein [Streptomyces sp. MJP52]